MLRVIVNRALRAFRDREGLSFLFLLVTGVGADLTLAFKVLFGSTPSDTCGIFHGAQTESL